MNNVYFLFISQHVFFLHLGSFGKENIQLHIITQILWWVHSFYPEPEKGHKTHCTCGLSHICSVLSVINIFRLSVCVISLSHILWHPDTMIEWCSALGKSSGARCCVVMFSDMRAKGLTPAFRTYIAQCYGCEDLSLIFIFNDALFGPWSISGSSDSEENEKEGWWRWCEKKGTDKPLNLYSSVKWVIDID